MEIERKRRKSPRIITNRLRSEMIPELRVKNCAANLFGEFGSYGGRYAEKKVSKGREKSK
jgi:hypothetical protein